MQMVINLAPVSLSNKKVNFYTYPKLTFLKKNAMGNADKRFSGGACPHTPLAARTFGARILPPLVLKSGYGPADPQKSIGNQCVSHRLVIRTHEQLVYCD